MDPEFLDPGPDQPPVPVYVPGAGALAAPERPAYGPPVGRRETLGLLIMLLAATALPLIASTQALFAVRERGLTATTEYAMDAWGEVGGTVGRQVYGHGPRFGIALVACGVGFGVLLLAATVVLLGDRARQPERTAGLLAGAATGLVGLLLGTALAMTLDIQSTFETLRIGASSAFTPVEEVRLRIGGAVWLSVAGMLAGGLSVSAALRVRRVLREVPPVFVEPDWAGWG